MCVPLTANGGIGVTACLLGNRLTNNLLRGIRDMKKMEDQLCLFLSHCISAPRSLFPLFCRFLCALFLLCPHSLLLHSRISSQNFTCCCTQMHHKVSMHGDVERGDRTHAQTHSISDTNAAAALLAVRSNLSCSLDKPPLLLLQGLLQVQGGVSNTAAVTVVVNL